MRPRISWTHMSVDHCIWKNKQKLLLIMFIFCYNYKQTNRYGAFKIIITTNDHLTHAPHVHVVLPQVGPLLSNTSVVSLNYQIPGRPNCQQMINHAYYCYSYSPTPMLPIKLSSNNIYMHIGLQLVLQVAAEKMFVHFI